MDRIIIDEEKNFALESFIKTKKGVENKKLDHNSILSKFKFTWNKNIKKQRNEQYNLTNSEGLKKFKIMTSQNILIGE